MPRTTRAVIYARYSSDNQREASIDDQVRACTDFVRRQGWSPQTVYSDHALSGASTLRPGYQRLLEDARAGGYEVLVAEGLDRLSRDQADVATLYKLLSFCGIRIVTVAEGEISELHVGLKGTMNALYLKDLAQKTRRGLEGRVRAGRSGGGLCYGYDVVREIGPDGQPVFGKRAINPAEAEVVRRIFREFAAGSSPRAIAKRLNQARVPGPRGAEWRDTAIRGHVTRGTGILNNELYVGRIVWNRLTYVKDPTTGRRRSRLNPPDRLIVQEVPELRIIDDDLWDAVRARQSGIRTSDGVVRARKTRFWERRRAQHILTGLVFCGRCGGPLASVGRDYLACSAARGRGTCESRASVRRGALENAILNLLNERLMAPELVEEFITAFHAEINRQRREGGAMRAAKQAELAGIERKLDGLVDAIAEGFRAPDLQARLDELSARRNVLRKTLDEDAVPPVRLHPNLAQIYRRKVEQLHAALADPEIHDEAVAILRGLIERVVIHRSETGVEVELIGEIVQMVTLGANGPKAAVINEATGRSVKVVAGAGFEPATFRL